MQAQKSSLYYSKQEEDFITSGLLMLVELAGLALRRRRA
jgi:hypothetical protein